MTPLILAGTKARKGGIVQDPSNPVDLAHTGASKHVLEFRAKRALVQGILLFQQGF